MTCPKCGELDLYRDEVDVGVGVMYGPYGCPVCGWSQSPAYDLSDGPKEQDGHRLDQWGGLHPS